MKTFIPIVVWFAALANPLQGQWETIISGRFRISVERGVNDRAVARLEQTIEEGLELYRTEWNLNAPQRISIAVYKSSQTFQRATNAARSLAAVWDGATVHIQNPLALARRKSFRMTVVHELAHALLHERWKRALPLWFEEGFAVYSSGEFPTLTQRRKPITSLATFDEERAVLRSGAALQAWYHAAGLLVFVMVRQYGKAQLARLVNFNPPLSLEAAVAALFRTPFSLFEKQLLAEFNYRVAKRKLPS